MHLQKFIHENASKNFYYKSFMTIRINLIKLLSQYNAMLSRNEEIL
jgi:uncharacterized membrane protein